MVRQPYKKRRKVTLIEIMIVIVLIGLIGGVLAYNMRGSLDEGKAFKTKQAKAQIENILLLAQAEGKDITSTSWQTLVKASPLIKNANEILVDGWKKEWKVTITDNAISITSDALDKYEADKNSLTKSNN